MLLALIFVVPAFFPVTFPALETVAILLFIEVHVTRSPFAGFFSFIVVEFPVYTEIGVLEMLAIYLFAACTGIVIKNTIVKSIIVNPSAIELPSIPKDATNNATDLYL